MWIWRRRKFEGEVLLAFGAVYGFGRAALEVLRDDYERGVYAGWSTSQIIGIATAVACAALWLRRSRGRGDAAREPTTESG